MQTTERSSWSDAEQDEKKEEPELSFKIETNIGGDEGEGKEFTRSRSECPKNLTNQ